MHKFHREVASLTAPLERYSRMLLDSGVVRDMVSGAISISEMAYLMAWFDVLGIRRIIESGRQDGYSTLILGAYAQATGAEIISFDYEDDKERARRCRARLAKYNIDLQVGDTWDLMWPAVTRSNEPTAILVDGPKHWSGLTLLCASAEAPQVKLIASHNLGPGSPCRKFFQSLSDVPVGYPEVVGEGPSVWQELLDVERQRIDDIGLSGKNFKTTLGTIPVEASNREQIANARHPGFRLYSPRTVRWLWKTGNYSLLKRLVWTCGRLLGPEKDQTPETN